MNKRFKQIYELSGKPILVIGLMSGTTDGLDIAYRHCSEQGLEVKEYPTVPYDEKYVLYWYRYNLKSKLHLAAYVF